LQRVEALQTEALQEKSIARAWFGNLEVSHTRMVQLSKGRTPIWNFLFFGYFIIFRKVNVKCI